MNVLVIPEDFRKDQWMLKPLIEALMSEIGKPRAYVRVCQNPLLGGIGEALKWENIAHILELYPMVDLFLLCVDRDLDHGRANALKNLECQGCQNLPGGRALLAENAWQEIEVWVLAGMDGLPKDWPWKNIRDERDPKEIYFKPYAQSRGLLSGPGEGRKTLGAEAAHNYRRIRSRCVEDIARLENRTREWMAIYERAAIPDPKSAVLAWLG